MVSRITAEQVRHTARLARLAFTEEETERLALELNSILTFADQLNELDTENIEPATHILPIRNVMREDEPAEGLPLKDVLKNAPDHRDGQIRVPSVLE